jgi:hypothetical protein
MSVQLHYVTHGQNQIKAYRNAIAASFIEAQSQICQWLLKPQLAFFTRVNMKVLSHTNRTFMRHSDLFTAIDALVRDGCS